MKIVISLLILASLQIGQQPLLQVRQSGIEVVLVKGRSVPSRFLRHGNLSVYSQLVSHSKATERMVLAYGRRRLLIGRSLLRGHVRIDSGEDALAYVRLFSNPNTSHTIDYALGVEIRAREELNSKDWMFAGHTGVVAGRLPEGYLGVCSSVTLGLFPNWAPVTRKIDSEYVVERAVIRRDAGSGTWKAFMVTEKINRVGKYEMIGIRSFEPQLLKDFVHWAMPSFD